MSVSLLKLSLNEVRFYFTRAAVGVGVPFGLAEDFGRSVSWLACSGLDPARICAPVLQSLESGQSSLYPKLNQWNGEALLKPPPDKLLSAIQAGSFASDWIVPMEQKSGKNSYLSAENVDYPFLVAAALGASGCSGWEISWETSSEDRFLINYEENRSWDAFWSDRVVPENSGPGRLKITPADIGELDRDVWLIGSIVQVKMRQLYWKPELRSMNRGRSSIHFLSAALFHLLMILIKQVRVPA